ncbi:MAG: GDSL-type esterase/lipase family protein, partial [Cyanobacteria bacterium J06598_3]
VTDGYDFINRGIASQTSAQVLQRFSAHVVPLDPDIIVIQVGINDLKTIGLFPEQAEDIMSAYQANMRALVALAQQETEATVVVSTILPAGDVTWARRLVWSDAIDQAVIEMNESLKTRANGTDVFIFDGFSLIAAATAESGRSAYYKDELHFTQLGYDLLNEPLLALLRSLPPVDQTPADQTPD